MVITLLKLIKQVHKNTVMNAGWRHIYELSQYFTKNSKLPEEQHIL